MNEKVFKCKICFEVHERVTILDEMYTNYPESKGWRRGSNDEWVCPKCADGLK